MPNCLIAGNWKMHGSLASVRDLLSTLLEQHETHAPVQAIVFPPTIFIPETQAFLKNSGINWGAQDVSEHEQGAYTGQVSAAMLKDFGCRYVLVGHSERRQYNGETNDIVAEKFIAAQHVGLMPILCIGETLAQRQSLQTHEILRSQLLAVVERAGILAFSNAVVAYEPVWAIGTGLAATPEQAQDIHAFCRGLLANYSPAVAESLSILYGGSVKADNAAELLAKPDINGALVGGASLDGLAFAKILTQANQLTMVN